MTVTDSYSYYSKLFNIICEEEPPVLDADQRYKLNVLLNQGPDATDGPVLLKTVDNLTEAELDNAYEELKTETYLNLDL